MSDIAVAGEAARLPSTAATAASTSTSTSTGADASKQRKALERQATEFEAVYLSEMLKPMFEGLRNDGPFGGGFGEDVGRSLQIQEFGKAIARNGGVGLADTVRKELLAAQEARSGGTR